MSIKDTIKSLEEADDKLKKAVGHEKEAVEMHKKAAILREESERDLEKVRIERSAFETLQTEREAASERHENDLKNREVTVAAKLADLDRNTAESNKKFDLQHSALDARSVAADTSERQNKEFEVTLDKRAETYKSIQEFIAKAL